MKKSIQPCAARVRRGLYGHPHSIAEKTDSVMGSSDRGIRAPKISLLGLGVTATLQLVIVLFSGSVALLADTIHNFADAGTRPTTL